MRAKEILLATIENQQQIIDEQAVLLNTRWKQLKTSWKREEMQGYSIDMLTNRIKEFEQGENNE